MNEEVKLSTLEAVGCWLLKCHAPPESVQDLFSKGLTGKDTLKKGTLKALVQALENPELRSQASYAMIPLLYLCHGTNQARELCPCAMLVINSCRR